jgi:hypothetical protein
MSTLAAFGGLLGIRVARRAAFEHSLRSKRAARSGGAARPGEKLFEELQYSGESIDKTRHPKIFIGKIAGVPGEEESAGGAGRRRIPRPRRRDRPGLRMPGT